MRTVTGEAIDASAQQEVSPCVLRRAEQFVDIALAVTNVDTSVGVAERGGRLPQVVQPANALLLFDRHAGRVDMPLGFVRAVELLSGPELDRRQSERQALRGHCQAGMHQNAARRITSQSPESIGACNPDVRLAHGVDVFALVGELRRVVQHKYWTGRLRRAIARRLEMTSENLGLTDSIVVEESVRRFRVRPVLADQRNAPAGAGGKMPEQRSKTLAETLVLELAVGKFAVDPRARRRRIGNSRPPALSNIFVRHAAPCESNTRTTYISTSRISCKNFLQLTDSIHKIVGN